METQPTDKATKELDWTKSQGVQYAVPLWLRDEQIRINTSKVKGRIQPQYDKRDDPIAIVCYGPSLNDTWEKVKDFKYVMTCSGSHRFLIDRGIVPNWHVEVDPRPHKIKLLGQPHKDVEYLVASACSPEYVDHLKDFNIKLWHVFDAQEDGLRQLPMGEWSLTGGCDVGLRAMVIAYFFGFRDIHVFAMDGSEGKSGKHAAAHPNQPKKSFPCDYNGTTYLTTPGMLEAARSIPHELDQMPEAKVTFYGEGLSQAIARDYKRKDLPNGTAIVGFKKPELISPEYSALNSQLHKDNLAYGVGGGKHAPTIQKLATSLNTTSVLDYGCGKGYLAKTLPFPIWEYDPAIPEKSESPRPADIVVCTDVLEHIEPDKLPAVLSDLKRCTRKVGFFVIHTGAAVKVLSDGRNAHLIQQGETWWRKKLTKFFTVAWVKQVGKELYVVVGPKVKK